MQKKLVSLAEQGLFASAVFILFLLIFGNKIVIPVWLQPFGRMHPLILHFPIVLLLLAVVMEAFRFTRAIATKQDAGPEFIAFFQEIYYLSEPY